MSTLTQHDLAAAVAHLLGPDETVLRGLKRYARREPGHTNDDVAANSAVFEVPAYRQKLVCRDGCESAF